MTTSLEKHGSIDLHSVRPQPAHSRLPGTLTRGSPSSYEPRQQAPIERHGLAALGTTVAVWAHPDDETYLAGGLLAALRDEEQRVVCATATRGDAGNGLHDGGSSAARWALAQLRASELDAALDVLGVAEHLWLDYADSVGALVDPDEAVDRLHRIFDEVRPQTVVSFGPDGFTGHPDHQAVSRWTELAVQRWHPRPQLLQAVTTTRDRDAARDIDGRLETYGWAFPPSLAMADLAVRVELRGDELGRKVEALRRQFSQTAELIAAIGEQRFADWVSAESFRRA